jgi:sugar phosphate isomerase/epimerase
VFAGPVPEGHTEDEAVAWAVECLQECAEYGQSRGVVVALENHGGITATGAQVDRLVRAVNHPWFGINLDFGNYRTPYEEYAQSAPHTVTTHAKVTHRTLTGETARVDYAHALEIVAAAGYRGYINIEYEEPEDPKAGVPAFVEELKKVIR